MAAVLKNVVAMATSTWNKLVSNISKRFRSKRGQLLREQFPELASMRIVDVGGSLHFWQESGLNIPPEHLTIYNVGAGDAHAAQSDVYSRVSVKTYDGRRLPEHDQSFDLAICNSVIEHVPLEQRDALVAELQRVAKHVYVQTPAKSFPIEPHFLVPLLQWLPKRLGYTLAKVSPWRLLSRPSRATIKSYFFGTNLLTAGAVRTLLPNAKLFRERLLGFTKSYVAIQ